MQLRIGDRMVEVEMVNGMPTIKGTWTEEIKHEDGSQDVVVHVPCLQIQAKENK